MIQHPNFFGCLEDVEAIAKIAHEQGALLVVACDPISLGLLKRPGDLGVDVVVAEGQSLGTPMQYRRTVSGHHGLPRTVRAPHAGPYRGTNGRSSRQTLLGADAANARTTHSPRKGDEQYLHESRPVCLAHGDLFVGLGPAGLREAAELCLRKAHYAAEQITKSDRFSLAFDQPYFKEFVVRDSNDDVKQLLAAAQDAGFFAGIPLGTWYPELEDWFLVTVTEKRVRSEIDALANCLGSRFRGVHFEESQSPNKRNAGAKRHISKMRNTRATQMVFELSRSGRRGLRMPASDVPERPLDELLPSQHRAEQPPALPELTEPEVVRHFTNLSTLNMSVDTHFYPLGSCTMKHNPKRNERLANLPNIVDLHPLQPDDTCQGCCNCCLSCRKCSLKFRGSQQFRCNRRPVRTAS